MAPNTYRKWSSIRAMQRDQPLPCQGQIAPSARSSCIGLVGVSDECAQVRDRNQRHATMLDAAQGAISHHLEKASAAQAGEVDGVGDAQGHRLNLADERFARLQYRCWRRHGIKGSCRVGLARKVVRHQVARLLGAGTLCGGTAGRTVIGGQLISFRALGALPDWFIEARRRPWNEPGNPIAAG